MECNKLQQQVGCPHCQNLSVCNFRHYKALINQHRRSFELLAVHFPGTRDDEDVTGPLERFDDVSTKAGLQLRSSFASIIENVTFRRFFELTRQYIYQKKENRKSDTNPLGDSLRQLVAKNGGRKTTTFANDLERKWIAIKLIALHDHMAPTCDQRPSQIEVPPSCPHLPTSLPHSRLRTSTNLHFCRLRRWSSCSGRQTNNTCACSSPFVCFDTGCVLLPIVSCSGMVDGSCHA